MNILIDARVGQYPNIGVGVYVNSLVWALEKVANPDDNINLLLFPGKKLHPLIKQCSNIKIHPTKFGLEWSPEKELKDAIQTNRVIKKNSIDIFHSPFFLKPMHTRCKRIVTIHDLFVFGAWVDSSLLKKLWWQYLTRYSVIRSDGIITVSDYTKDLIHKRHNIPIHKTRTIYHGPGYINQENLPRSNIRVANAEKYILFVGSPKPNKNLSCLIEAFSTIADPISREYILLLVGPKPVWADELLDILKVSSTNRIRWMEAVSDELLQSIYEKAQLFIHPSFVEGFGLPLVEAMACGLPIVASDIPINHEIAGNAAVYFDPCSSTDLRRKIEEVLADSILRGSLKGRSLERAHLYSWDVCAKQHLAVYKDVLEV